MNTSVSSKIRLLNRFFQQLNYIPEPLSPTRIKITVPGGLQYDAFEKSSTKPQAWNLLSLAYSTTFFSFFATPGNAYRNSYVNVHRYVQDAFFFLGGLKMEVNHNLYKMSSPKFPLTVTNTLTYVGKSSICQRSEIACPLYTHHPPYAVVNSQFILVDTNTRRPVTLPKCWKHQFEHIVESDTPLSTKFDDKPQKTNIYHVSVRQSDTGFSRHVPGENLVRFCYDACRHEVSKNHYKTLTEGTMGNGVKSVEMAFKRESIMGDSLEILSWEEDVNKRIAVNFIIQQNDIAYSLAKLEFFTEDM